MALGCCSVTICGCAGCSHQIGPKYLTEEVSGSEMHPVFQDSVLCSRALRPRGRDVQKNWWTDLRAFWKVAHQNPKHIIVIWLVMAVKCFNTLLWKTKTYDKGRDCAWSCYWVAVSCYVPMASTPLIALRWCTACTAHDSLCFHLPFLQKY